MGLNDTLRLTKVYMVSFCIKLKHIKKSLKVKIFLNFFGTYKEVHQVADTTPISANIKLSKTQLHKIRQSGGFLGRLLEPLLKIGLLLIGNVLKPLAKSVLIPLGLTAAAAAAAATTTDAAIHQKTFESRTTTLTISNEEMNDIMKIVKSLEESGLLITIRNKAKEQK